MKGISKVYIAGQIKKAIFKKDNIFFCVEIDDSNNSKIFPFTRYEFNSFYIAKPELEIHDNINWNLQQLIKALNNSIKKFEVLHLFLMSMDGTYSILLRKEIMQLLLENLFSNREVFVFICNRIFGSSLPDNSDLLVASGIASEFSDKRLSNLYKKLELSKEMIHMIRNFWKQYLLTFKEQIILDLEQLDKRLTDDGIFANFVLSTLKIIENVKENLFQKNKDDNPEHSILVGEITDSELNKKVDILIKEFREESTNEKLKEMKNVENEPEIRTSISTSSSSEEAQLSTALSSIFNSILSSENINKESPSDEKKEIENLHNEIMKNSDETDSKIRDIYSSANFNDIFEQKENTIKEKSETSNIDDLLKTLGSNEVADNGEDAKNTSINKDQVTSKHK